MCVDAAAANLVSIFTDRCPIIQCMFYFFAHYWDESVYVCGDACRANDRCDDRLYGSVVAADVIFAYGSRCYYECGAVYTADVICSECARRLDEDGDIADVSFDGCPRFA